MRLDNAKGGGGNESSKASGQLTVQAQHSISGRDRSYVTFWTPWSNADLSAGRLDDATSSGAWADVLVRAAGELANPFSPERLRRGRWAPLVRWLSARMSPVAFGAGGGDADRPVARWWMRKGEEVPEAQGIPKIVERWRAANRAGLGTLDWWARDVPTCEELLASLFSDPVAGGDQRSRAGPLTAPHPLLGVRVPEPPRRIRWQVPAPSPP